MGRAQQNPSLSAQGLMGFASLYPSYANSQVRQSLGVEFSLRRARRSRRDIERARALVLVLAVRQRRTAVPAKPRRERLQTANDAALLIARKIDDVAWRYVFLNHGVLVAWEHLIADKLRSIVQCTAQILAVELRRASHVGKGREPRELGPSFV